MKTKPFILMLFYCFFLLTDRVFGIGERILTLGADSSWELMETRQGIIEASLIRPNPVLVLSNERQTGGLRNARSLDLHLSFDEANPARFADSQGRYDVFVSPELARAAAPLSRAGTGAALFTGRTGANRTADPLVLRPRPSALFASNNHIRDFTIEFWLYPMDMITGGQILSWSASKPNGAGTFIHQQIQCIVIRNRLQWTFTDFFFSPGALAGGAPLPGEINSLSLTLTGPVLLNRTWSHHVIRFDADLGRLEYLVDGRLEALVHTTSNGRESGEIFTPFIGEGSRFALGAHFSGMIDEFRIYRDHSEQMALTRYPLEGGRVVTRALDLGRANSHVIRIDAFGGRTSNVNGRVRNEYTGNAALHFPDHAQVAFSFRVSNNPYRWDYSPWIPFNPGTVLPDTLRGRFIQIAADFFPGENGNSSPYLSELRVVFNAAEPPPPPRQIFAVAKDGAVELSWMPSSSRDVDGYLIFYGTTRGEFFGEHAIVESRRVQSPIDVGNRTSVRIEGLNNGTLYFFAVAAYRKPVTASIEERMFLLEKGFLTLEPGVFSREVAARPLRMAQ